MRWTRKLRLRLRSVFLPGRVERDLDAELQHHVDRLAEAHVAAGLAPKEARLAALREMAGVEQRKEECRDVRGRALVDVLSQDLRYAVRTLRRSPGSTLLGVLVMALAIGATTAVFSVVHAVLLNPLPYRDPGRIVTLSYGGSLNENGAPANFSNQVSIPDFVDWHAQSTAFDAMAYYTTRQTSVMAGPAAEYALVTRTSDEFFGVLDVRPIAGRLATKEETQIDRGGAAIVAYAYAQQHFGEPARALGQTLRMFDRPVPIVGVLPPGFQFPARTDIWVPFEVNAAKQHRAGNNFRAFGRVRSSVGLERAQAEMSSIAANLARQYPETNRNKDVVLTPLQRQMVGRVEPMLYLVFAAAGLVLLIGCVTTATLLLAKATTRAPEIAIRAALGASRRRIVGQLLVEALVQSLLAGAIGVLVAVWGTKALTALVPGDVPRLADASVNGLVLLFALAVSVLVSLLFGLPPALHAARLDVGDPLRHAAFRVVSGRAARLREALVVSEIALAVVLLAGSGLLLRSLVALQNVPLGFEPDNVLAMEATVPAFGPEGRRSNAFFQGLLSDVSALPGVVAAGATMAPPGEVDSSSGYWIDRMPKESPLASARGAVMSVAAPGTFAALGIPLRSGRDFRNEDTRGTPPVAIVNEALARQAFGAQNPIGRQIICGFDSLDPMTIIGVVGDVRQYGPAFPPTPEVYMPYLQHFYNNTTLHLVVRTAPGAAGLAEAIQRKARERSPDVSVRMTTMNARLSAHVGPPRFRALLVGLFAAIAVCLAMAGVYGVMSYLVSQRSKEIALRMALGATGRGVSWMVLERGLKLAGVGLALGLAGAVAATRLLSSMLFEVRPGDVTTYLAVVALLGGLSLLATYVPARRSTRVDPVTVLREQ